MPEDLTRAGVRGLLYERWNNVAGATVRDLLESEAFRHEADVTGLMSGGMSAAPGDGKDFGVRMRGWLVAPRSGTVRFAVSSDDNSELWLSPGESPFERRKVAWITGEGMYGSAASGSTGRIASQWSAPVRLEEGKRYYLEAYHKEAARNDHFSLQWRFEGQERAEIIPGEILLPWTGSDEDLDDDGLPDKWQEETGLAGRPDRAWWQDADGDKVSNFEEFIGRTNPLDGASMDGFLLLETWYGLPGSNVADLLRSPVFKGPAHDAVFVSASVTPKFTATHLGTRLSGYIVPKESGRYQFAVAGDDSVELWMSDDASRTGRTRVAFSDRWRGGSEEKEWSDPASRRTLPRELEAGKSYYFEVLHKDGVRFGWSALGWRLEGEKQFRPVSPEFFRSPGAERELAGGLPADWVERQSQRVEGLEQEMDLTEWGDPDGDGIPNLVEYQLGQDPFGRTEMRGGLTREWWFRQGGASLERSRRSGVFVKRPSMITFTQGALSEVNALSHFASRLRGRIVAPVSGHYRFWISADDQGELWLSDNDRKFFKRRIAAVMPEEWHSQDSAVWTRRMHWDARPAQRSEVVYLEKGEERFIELLHKELRYDDHVAVAWQYQEDGSDSWSPRRLVDAEALVSHAGDDDDLDDDCLPDEWEEKYGLDPKDNGSRDFKRQGELGDFDGDGLTNHEEFLLGTNPAQADSDGDGVSDHDEVRLYGTNPKVKDASPPVKHADLSVHQFVAPFHEWIFSAEGSIFSSGRRGSVDFTFELDRPGIYVVELKAKVRGGGGYVPSIPVLVSVDRREIGRGSVEAAGSTRSWVTPWLEAGTHAVTIDNRNVRVGLSLEIQGLTLYRHDGEDLDENGIPDWMENYFGGQNTIETVTVDSAVSPLFLEGASRFPERVELVAGEETIAATAGMPGRWYADVPLEEDGETVVAARFEEGALVKERSYRWVETNLLECADTLRVRVGDSMKFTARLADEVEGEAGVFSVEVEGAAVERKAAGTGRWTVTFGEPGEVVLKAAPSRKGSTVEAVEVKVEVVAADFGKPFFLPAGDSREWDLPGIPHDLFLEAEENLTLAAVERKSGQSRRMRASYPAGRAWQPKVLARLWQGGPVVAATRLDVYWIVAADLTRDYRVIRILPDGTLVIGLTLLVEGTLPPDFALWIDLKVPDAVFANGDSRYLLTADDFNGAGLAGLTIYKAPGGSTKICHRLRPEDQPGFED